MLTVLVIVARLIVLGVAESAVFIVAWWLNDTRRNEGPVLFALTNGHGVHRMDLLVIAAGLLIAVLVLGWPVRSASARKGNRVPPTVAHPPIGIPRTRRLGHDQ